VNSNCNTLLSTFLELEKEVKGVENPFIFPRLNAPEPENNLTEFKTTSMKALEDKIRERICRLPHSNSIKTNAVALTSNDLEVEGEITLTVNPQTDVEPLRRRVQTILNEEIPFFCRKQMTVEVKPKCSGLLNFKRLRREQLSRVIQRIQEMQCT